MVRRQHGLFWVFVAVAAFVIFVRGRLQQASTRSAREPRATIEESPALYQSEVEERPGTAIALLVDTSGSMELPAPSEGRPKYVVAREAIEHVLLATDDFTARRRDYPIRIAIIGFASAPWEVLPIQPYDHEAVSKALARLPRPGGGTAIGAALQAGREVLYRSGAIRKYVLVVTDGENTAGKAPDLVARDIFRKSRGAVSISFVAFDTNPAAFAFLREVGGDVVAAGDAQGLRQALQQIYEGKILAEAVDGGEVPIPAAAAPDAATPPRGRAR